MSQPLDAEVAPPLLVNGAADLGAADLGAIDRQKRAATRPTNVARSVFHVASALAALALIRLLPERWMLIGASGSFVLSAWTMEAARRRSVRVNERLMRFFGPVAHPHERHQVNSSTWYVTALLLLACFAPRLAAELGVVVLGVADPLAGVVGRRFGRTRIRAGRSLEGSLAFLTAGTLAGLATAWLFHPLALGPMLLVAAVGALVGAVTELFSTRLDDNFTIPIAVAVAVTVAAMVGGIPLT